MDYVYIPIARHESKHLPTHVILAITFGIFLGVPAAILVLWNCNAIVRCVRRRRCKFPRVAAKPAPPPLLLNTPSAPTPGRYPYAPPMSEDSQSAAAGSTTPADSTLPNPPPQAHLSVPVPPDAQATDPASRIQTQTYASE
ncbi:hypothetical protein B0H17DRAFT_1132760 [Mycena rosella]|uniref:Uncharacterized protein n=1 Tax=Mycena rosella TaxID=1033263 RepID=A0AAD7GG46_MYCRO|nr:hypothetical protein B0H17DRAFT_1132760 [Mycena rosella]